MRYRSGHPYFSFLGVNLPWLAGHLYLAYDRFVAVTRRRSRRSPWANAGQPALA
jgi:hypothetical protein